MRNIFLMILLLFLTVSCSKIENKIENLFEKRELQVNPKLVATPSKNPLKAKGIILLPLSGNYQYLGQNIIDAVQLALHELSADNISFRTIDIGSDSFSTQQAMNDLSLEDIDIILGPIFKEQAEIVYKYAQQKKLLMITYSNDLDLMNKPGLYIFDLIPYQQIKKVTNYATSKQYSNIYSIAPKNKYGNLIAKTLLANTAKDHYNIKEVLLYTPCNISIVKRFTLSEALLNIKSSIKSDSPNALSDRHSTILLAESNNNLIKIINQLQFLHSIKDPKYKILGIGDWSKYPLGQNLVAQKAWIGDIPHKLLYEFDDKFMDNYKYKSSRIAAIAYDSIMLISAILNKSSNGIIMKFQELENSNGYQGITGTFRLKSNSITERLYSVYEYQKGNMREISPAQKGFLNY